jgi:hypothetical protein
LHAARPVGQEGQRLLVAEVQALGANWVSSCTGVATS